MNDYEKAFRAYETASDAWKRAEALVTRHCVRCSWHLEAILAEYQDESSLAREMLSARQALAELIAARDSEREAFDESLRLMRAWMSVRDEKGGV